MTDKERLEKIKQDVKMTRRDLAVSPSNEITLHMDIMLNSMNYLIERVQELEEIIYQDERQAILEGLYEENKRYREALEEITTRKMSTFLTTRDMNIHFINTARKALESGNGDN